MNTHHGGKPPREGLRGRDEDHQQYIDPSDLQVEEAGQEGAQFEDEVQQALVQVGQ